MQFQQADFQREGFLDVGVEQSLRLFEGLHVFQGLARVEAAGYDPARYSGHSLRAGLATSAAQAGVPAWRIRQTTGHASDAMLARYIRDGEMFVGNAAGMLL